MKTAEQIQTEIKHQEARREQLMAEINATNGIIAGLQFALLDMSETENRAIMETSDEIAQDEQHAK